VRLSYYWTDCRDGSHVAVNYTVHEDRVSGSIRRWSRDARTNVGRKFEIPASEISTGEDGRRAILLEGLCEGPLRVPLET
jgi:hypothetical protein